MANKSGILTKIPSVLSYPEILDFKELVKHINGKLVYPIKYYPLEGFSIVLYRDHDDIAIKIGDWDGNIINLEKHKNGPKITAYLNDHLREIITIIKYVNIPQAQLYFSVGDKIRLVDLRVSQNKFMGPGMLKELFSKTLDVQEEVQKPILINDENVNLIKEGVGPFKGNVIVKTSYFGTLEKEKTLLPLYGKVIRDTPGRQR